MAANASVIRADHCGSFIRPDELKKARIERAHGRITAGQLAEVEDRAIRQVLDLQRAAGLDIYSDGEFRRMYFMTELMESLDGVENTGPNVAMMAGVDPAQLKDNPELAPPLPLATGKLRPKRRMTATELAFLRANSPGPYKITIPSPVMVGRNWYEAGVTDRFYPTWEDFFGDVTRIIADEVRAAVDDGVTYVQLDSPGYSRFIVPERRQQLVDQGIDPERELAAIIAAENECLRAGRREGVTVATHVCLGTYFLDGRGALGGSTQQYDADITGRLLNELDADVFLIEYSDRSGSLESLRLAPKDKVISLGILNVRDPQLESQDEVIRKIEAAAKYVPLENLSLSPNCGFSGASAGAWMSEDEQRRKLDLLVDTARKVWS